MYEVFYGLTQRPFNLTPDQRFLYLSEKHKEAFAHLLYGIKNRSGFVMLTGEIGTGKTTICRNLLSQLEEDETEVAFIFNPALNPVELLKKINSEFGVSSKADTVLELVEELNTYLLDAAARGISCVLVIDEAQNLAPQVLEQIRLLSNLETETAKLLQIVLIGQPELGEKLALHELRQLNQRITARYHLKALGPKETLQYIAYRLHVAGGRRKVCFAPAAVRAVYKFSGGTPRVINVLCDRALLIGYTKEVRVITRAIVKRAASEIRGERIVRKHSWPMRLRSVLPSPALALVALLLIAAVYFLVDRLAPSMREMAHSLDRFSRLFSPGDFDAPASEPTRDRVEASETPPAPISELTPEQVREAIRQFPFARKLLEQLAAEQSISAAHGLWPDALDTVAAQDAALRAIAQAWDVELALGVPDDTDAASLADFARALGFSVEQLRPALDQVLSVNFPALLRAETGTGLVWLALMGFDGEHLEILGAGGATFSVSRAEFAAHYAGEAQYWWRDPTPGAPALLQGRSGNAVAELKRQLQSLGHLDSAAQGSTFDEPTARAVARLQAKTGLEVDGIVGKQVRMVLASWDSAFDAPKLWKTADTQTQDTMEVAHEVAPVPRIARSTAPVSVQAPRAQASLPLPDVAVAAPAESLGPPFEIPDAQRVEDAPEVVEAAPAESLEPPVNVPDAQRVEDAPEVVEAALSEAAIPPRELSDASEAPEQTMETPAAPADAEDPDVPGDPDSTQEVEGAESVDSPPAPEVPVEGVLHIEELPVPGAQAPEANGSDAEPASESDSGLDTETVTG